MTIAIAGFVIGAASLNTGARYFAMVLMIAGGHGANAVVIAWVAKPMLRPRMKRAAAMSVNAGFAVGGILLVAFMRLALLRANKRLALLEAHLQICNLSCPNVESNILLADSECMNEALDCRSSYSNRR
jgi:hypothetical protein